MEMILLEECCEILDSMRVPITAANREEGPYPYYGANGIQDYVAEYIFDDELVLLAEDGGNFGSKTRPIAYRVSGKCWVNNHAHVLKPQSGLDADYLCYSLMFYNTDGLVNGATRQKLTQATMRKMQIPKRTLEEQIDIVEKLNKVVFIKNMRQQEIHKLDNLTKARFVELFGDPVQNTKGWETDVCKNLTSKIGSGATPKGGRESYGTEGISLIRSMNVYNNRFEYKDLAYITDEQADKLSNVTIEENDVLVNITGASVARCCIVPNELLPARVNQHVSIVRCKDKLLPEFLCSMFTEDNYQKLLWSIATSGGATREAITKQQIEDLILIVPPIELQKQFMDFGKQVDKSKVVVQKVLENKIDSDMINTVTAETVELLRGNINFIRNGEH